MKNFTAYLIPIIILTIFATLLLSIFFLKKPITGQDDMIKYVELIELNVETKKWNLASNNLIKLKSAWEKILDRIQFAASKGEIDNLNATLARLEGAIKAEDKLTTLIQLTVTKSQWDNLGK